MAAGPDELSQRAPADGRAEVLPELAYLCGRRHAGAAYPRHPRRVRVQLLRLPLQKPADVDRTDQPDRPVRGDVRAELSAARAVGDAELAGGDDHPDAGHLGRL